MIKLGQKVRDKITGFEGIATIRTLQLTGIERLSVLSPLKDNKMGEEYAFDVNQLEVVDETQIMKPIDPPKARFKFKEQVQDPITGFEGRVVSRSIMLNGCVRVGCQAELDAKGRVPKTEFFEEQLLESIEPEETKKKLTEDKRKTGGPGRAAEPRSF